MVQAVEVRDVLGRFGKASGLDAGVILSTWNPDAGWEKDALVSLLRSFVVYFDVRSRQPLPLHRAGAPASPSCHRGTLRNEGLQPCGVLCRLEAQNPV